MCIGLYNSKLAHSRPVPCLQCVLAKNFLFLQIVRDMATLVDRGINSFKFFMAYKGALQVTDSELIDGLQRCKQLGALPMVSLHFCIMPLLMPVRSNFVVWQLEIAGLGAVCCCSKISQSFPQYLIVTERCSTGAC